MSTSSSTPWLRVKRPADVPPGGAYHYVDPETSKRLWHPYFVQLRLNARAYRFANQLPVGTHWEREFEDNVCRNSQAPCEPVEGPVRSAWRTLQRFTQAMAAWVAAGLPLVSDETLAQRRSICEGTGGRERCHEWAGGGRYFGFGRCGRCGCAGGLKSALATERCPLGKWPS